MNEDFSRLCVQNKNDLYHTIPKNNKLQIATSFTDLCHLCFRKRRRNVFFFLLSYKFCKLTYLVFHTFMFMSWDKAANHSIQSMFFFSLFLARCLNSYWRKQWRYIQWFQIFPQLFSPHTLCMLLLLYESYSPMHLSLTRSCTLSIQCGWVTLLATLTGSLHNNRVNHWRIETYRTISQHLRKRNAKMFAKLISPIDTQ